MTETTTPANDPAPPATDPATPPADDPQQPKPTAEQRRDAARLEKLTEQLKNTSAERDQLRERVMGYHRKAPKPKMWLVGDGVRVGGMPDADPLAAAQTTKAVAALLRDARSLLRRTDKLAQGADIRRDHDSSPFRGQIVCRPSSQGPRQSRDNAR
jgi:hypothetical protein